MGSVDRNRGLSLKIKREREVWDDNEAAEKQVISVGLTDEGVLDCPICLEPLTIPVFQCSNGHHICLSCCDKVKQNCPSCSRKVGDIRCRAIEGVLKAVKVHCSYKPHGCPSELNYSAKRWHEANCPYGNFRCPLDNCCYLGNQRGLSHHLNSNAHASSVVCLRFDQPCPFSMRKDKKLVVFREEENGTLFILTNYDRMAVSCIGESDMLPYSLAVRGKGSCSLTFESITSPFVNTPTGGCGTVCGPSEDFIEVPSYLFGHDGCLKLELCVSTKGGLLLHDISK